VVTVYPAVTVAGVVPPLAHVQTLGTRQFSAVADGGVTWSVDEDGGGSISAAGLYSAPATAGAYHVRATSADNPLRSAAATADVAYPDSGTLDLEFADEGIAYFGGPQDAGITPS